MGTTSSGITYHHMYAVCLEKNTSTKHKYVINQKLEQVEDISFRELFGRIRGVLQNKICLFLSQGILIYVDHSFL